MTSQSTAPLGPPGGPHTLRLRLSASRRTAGLDGAWWPRSRDLRREVAHLVDDFPAELGRVDRVLYSGPDWDDRPRSVAVRRGRVKTGSFPGDDTHLVVLTMSTRDRLQLLVVPPGHQRGQQTMTRAVDPASRATARQLLDSDGADEDSSSRDHWTDDGVTWWSRPEDGPPSYR